MLYAIMNNNLIAFLTLNQTVNANEIANVRQSACDRYRPHDGQLVHCLLRRDFFCLPRLRALLLLLEIWLQHRLWGSCCENGFGHDSDRGFFHDYHCGYET